MAASAEVVMEKPSFWRERETRFLALVEPRLTAMRTDADAARVLAHLSDDLLRALRTADNRTEDLGAFAQRVGHIAALVLRHEYIRQWAVSADSHDPFARGVVIDRFRDEAALSARGADLVATGLSADEAVDRWLDALADPESPYWKRSGGEWIDDVAAASAALCEKLAGKAYEIERTAASAEPPTKARDTSQLLTIKKAAELLKCHEDTIRAMGKRGEIEICNTGPRRQRIKASEIMRLRNTPKFVHR